MLLCRSTFDSIMEAQCFQGIVDWMNVAATSKKYPHAPMTSWFYWAYNPDSGGIIPSCIHPTVALISSRPSALDDRRKPAADSVVCT